MFFSSTICHRFPKHSSKFFKISLDLHFDRCCRSLFLAELAVEALFWVHCTDFCLCHLEKWSFLFNYKPKPDAKKEKKSKIDPHREASELHHKIQEFLSFKVALRLQSQIKPNFVSKSLFFSSRFLDFKILRFYSLKILHFLLAPKLNLNSMPNCCFINKTFKK